MPGCAIAKCSNNERNSIGKGITFYRIPKDEGVRKAWIHACKRADTFNEDTAKVCSVHFNDDDFERDLKAELLNIKPKRYLKSGVIPRFNIPTVENKHVNPERAVYSSYDDDQPPEQQYDDQPLEQQNDDQPLEQTSNVPVNKPWEPIVTVTEYSDTEEDFSIKNWTIRKEISNQEATYREKFVKRKTKINK